MNVIDKPISELLPYDNNPKLHTEKQIGRIMKSIELTKGLRQPIVIDRNNVVVCGHGRLIAAQRLGLISVPCELVDDLTDDEIAAYRLLDNEIAKGETDWDLFNEELDKIEDVDMDDFDLDVPDMFSVDGLDDNMDVSENEGDYWTTKLTFPMDKKEQVSAYLKEHKEDICREIIARSEG